MLRLLTNATSHKFLIANGWSVLFLKFWISDFAYILVAGSLQIYPTIIYVKRNFLCHTRFWLENEEKKMI